MSPSILIAGIGNIFNGDDGFGVEVAARLASGPVTESVRVVDYGIRGIDLIFALLDGYDAAILVDAVSRGGAPGTLYVIEPDLDDTGAGAFESAHGLDPLKVLSTARSLGAPLGRIFVLGCEPEALGDDMRLSEAVNAAVDPALEMIRSLVNEINEHCGKACVR